MPGWATRVPLALLVCLLLPWAAHSSSPLLSPPSPVTPVSAPHGRANAPPRVVFICIGQDDEHLFGRHVVQQLLGDDVRYLMTAQDDMSRDAGMQEVMDSLQAQWSEVPQWDKVEVVVLQMHGTLARIFNKITSTITQHIAANNNNHPLPRLLLFTCLYAGLPPKGWELVAPQLVTNLTPWGFYIYPAVVPDFRGFSASYPAVLPRSDPHKTVMSAHEYSAQLAAYLTAKGAPPAAPPSPPTLCSFLRSALTDLDGTAFITPFNTLAPAATADSVPLRALLREMTASLAFDPVKLITCAADEWQTEAKLLRSFKNRIKQKSKGKTEETVGKVNQLVEAGVRQLWDLYQQITRFWTAQDDAGKAFVAADYKNVVKGLSVASSEAHLRRSHEMNTLVFGPALAHKLETALRTH